MSYAPLSPAEQVWLISLGIDKRWLFAPKDQLTELVVAACADMKLSVPDRLGVAIPQAVACIASAKQNAIKRHLATGLLNMEQSQRDDASSLEKVDAGFVNRVSTLLGKSNGQSRRYLAALDLAVDQVTVDTTVLLESEHIRSPRTQVKVFRIDSLLQLAIGYGASPDQLMPAPFEFIANTASLALRMLVDRVAATDKSGAAYLREKKAFPAIPWGGRVNATSSVGSLPPVACMALYGLYLWQSRLSCQGLRDRLDENTIRDTFFYAANHLKWIYPELIGVQHLADVFESDPRYALGIRKSVEQVGLAVGKMLLAFAPYTKSPS